MLKYKTSTLYRRSIAAVEVERETVKSVWIEFRHGVYRYNKVSEYERFFDTFDEARAYLVERAESELAACETRTKEAKQRISEAKALKPQETHPCNETE